MNTNNTFNPYQPQKKAKKKFKSHANFIEALRDTGSSIAKDTVKGLAQDVVGGITKQTMDTVLNTGSSTTGDQPNNQENFNFEEYVRTSENREKMIRQHQQVKNEYERGEVEIFNQREIETKKQIEGIKAELSRIAHEMVNLDSSAQAMIQQEVVAPGTYHLNYFQKFLKFLQTMRKKVVDGRNWANLHNQRNQSKSYYWSQSDKKKGGTSFMLSGERSVVTQTG